MPRICYVNKMDRMGANFKHCVDGIRERLSVAPLLCQVPIGSHDQFRGMVDLIEGQAYLWSSDDPDDKDATWEVVAMDDIAGRANVSNQADIQWLALASAGFSSATKLPSPTALLSFLGNGTVGSSPRRIRCSCSST